MHAIHIIWMTRPICWVIQAIRKYIAKYHFKNKSKDKENIHIPNLSIDEEYLGRILGMEVGNKNMEKNMFINKNVDGYHPKTLLYQAQKRQLYKIVVLKHGSDNVLVEN